MQDIQFVRLGTPGNGLHGTADAQDRAQTEVRWDHQYQCSGNRAGIPAASHQCRRPRVGSTPRPGPDLVFSEGVAIPKGVGRERRFIIRQILVPENCMKIKKIWTRASKMCLCTSATVIFCY